LTDVVSGMALAWQLNVQLSGVMRTLFTANMISKSGYLETNPTPNERRKANLENHQDASGSLMPLSWSAQSCWSVIRHDGLVLMRSQLG
jgi:hypothetical protein